MPQPVCKKHMNFKKDFQSKGYFKSECKCCNDYMKHQEKIVYARGCCIQGLKMLNNSLVEEIQELQELLAGEDTNETASECIVCKEKRCSQIILSCGHLTCHSCMAKIENSKNCVICRQVPEYAKLIYFV